jgi:hypothetical protein
MPSNGMLAVSYAVNSAFTLECVGSQLLCNTSKAASLGHVFHRFSKFINAHERWWGCVMLAALLRIRMLWAAISASLKDNCLQYLSKTRAFTTPLRHVFSKPLETMCLQPSLRQVPAAPLEDMCLQHLSEIYVCSAPLKDMCLQHLLKNSSSTSPRHVPSTPL